VLRTGNTGAALLPLGRIYEEQLAVVGRNWKSEESKKQSADVFFVDKITARL